MEMQVLGPSTNTLQVYMRELSGAHYRLSLICNSTNKSSQYHVQTIFNNSFTSFDISTNYNHLS
jgi:hypothetical protein